jgi:hypothetical protein
LQSSAKRYLYVIPTLDVLRSEKQTSLRLVQLPSQVLINLEPINRSWIWPG